jgi:membrane-bound lytic murein transglycosylase A
VPLGSPIYLSTTRPNDSQPMNRLIQAQDTGGAIAGPIRVDYFWGFGAKAGQLAGRMKQKGQVWLLWPKGWPCLTVLIKFIHILAFIGSVFFI